MKLEDEIKAQAEDYTNTEASKGQGQAWKYFDVEKGFAEGAKWMLEQIKKNPKGAGICNCNYRMCPICG